MSKDSKSVLLLGGAGFIGRRLAEVLAQRETFEITIADNFFRQGGKIDKSFTEFAKSKNIQIVSADLTDPDSFNSLPGKFDQVYMLASMVGVDYVNSIPHEIIRVNTALIYNTLEWLKKSQIKKLVFTSTSEAYAGAIETFGYKVPTDEEVPLTISDISHPRFTYAVTKMLGESGFLNYARMLDFECSIVRYHNAYGPRMGFKHVIPHLVQRFRANEDPFKIFGHDQTRAFNYIDDAVEGTILTMEKGTNLGIYHIGTQEEISIRELVLYVGELMNFSGTYEDAPTYPGSVSRRCPDISKAQKELGYKPRTAWKDGVKRTIEWYKDYLSSNPELHESFYDKKRKEG